MKTLTWTTVLLSSGREVYACEGVFGLMENGTLTYGYDGFVEEHERLELWTHAERVELADAMIMRWEKFKGD